MNTEICVLLVEVVANLRPGFDSEQLVAEA